MSTQPIRISRDVICGTWKSPGPAPEPGTIFIANGTYSPESFSAAINAQSPSGPVIIKPATPGGVTVTDGWNPTRYYMTLDGIIFDGVGRTRLSWYPGVKFFVLRNCTFRRFWTTNPDDHTQALYLGGDCSDGVIEDCIFDDNGNTAHIFFTWFGDIEADPDRICIRRCVFTNCHNPYFDINFRSEILPTRDIYIEPTNSFEYGVDRQEFVRMCPG